MPKLLFLSMPAAFAAAGFLIGWLTGSSHTPVVATVLPLIVGLLGAYSFTMLDKTTKSLHIRDAMLKCEIDEPQVSRVLERAELPAVGKTSIPIWSLSIMLFCLTAYFAVQLGVSHRNHPKLPTCDLLSLLGVDLTSISELEYSAVSNLRYRMELLGLPESEISNAMRYAIAPVLGMEDTKASEIATKWHIENEDEQHRFRIIQAITNQIMKDMPIQKPDKPPASFMRESRGNLGAG